MASAAKTLVACLPTRHRHWRRVVPRATADGALDRRGLDLPLLLLLTPVVALMETCKQNKRHKATQSITAGLLFSSFPDLVFSILQMTAREGESHRGWQLSRCDCCGGGGTGKGCLRSKIWWLLGAAPIFPSQPVLLRFPLPLLASKGVPI